MYKNEDFCQLVIRKKQDGRYIWLKCLKATAELYGWDKAFTPLIEQQFKDSPDGYIRCPSKRGWTSGGGKEHRISRSPKTSGWPAGLTNTFRLSSDATLVDLAEVAKATEIDWEWVTCDNGGRRTKEWFDQATMT